MVRLNYGHREAFLKKRAPMTIEVAERLRARRGMRKVAARRPKKAQCHVPNCDTLIDQPMCEFHWGLVDGEVRRRVVEAVKELKFHGGRKPTEKILELFTEAIQQASYREGAARAKEAVGAVRAAAPPPRLIQHALPPSR